MSQTQASLLLVDDNEMNRDMLSRRLERRGFSVVLAKDGQQALDLIQAQRFDLVLLDVMMPGIDGLQVLKHVRATHSMKDLPIVMATAKDQSEDVVRALELGANDYVTKPLDFPVVLARIQTQLSLKRASEALQAAHARMKRDLEAAAQIQYSLMPSALPSGRVGKFAWKYQPCDELAGDILGVEQLDEKHVGLYVLDVSGHGVPSALLAVTLSRVLSHTGEGSILTRPPQNGSRQPGLTPPSEVAAHLNRRFPMNPETRQYFTLAYGILDADSREFVFTSAGHPGPVHLRQGEQPQVLTTCGFPIGWFPNVVYEESRITLEPGDRLILYSDGLVDAAGPQGEHFGKERLLKAIENERSTPLGKSLDVLLEVVKEWCGAGGLDDDVSILGIEIE